MAEPCPHWSWTGDEGPVELLGRMPRRWKCDSCGALKSDPPVPEELRAILAEVYRPDGVEVWWTGHHKLLGEAACEAWAKRRSEVLAEAQRLVDGAFA